MRVSEEENSLRLHFAEELTPMSTSSALQSYKKHSECRNFTVLNYTNKPHRQLKHSIKHYGSGIYKNMFYSIFLQPHIIISELFVRNTKNREIHRPIGTVVIEVRQMRKIVFFRVFDYEDGTRMQ